MFYAIEHAYGGNVVNNGQRADRILEFSSRKLRDAWVADGPVYIDAPGYRSKAGARDSIVRKADWKDDGDSEGWSVLAHQRVESAPKLQPYRDILIDYDWCDGNDHSQWVATAKEKDILDWAQTIQEQA
jgi:sulfur carrier protein ThiS